MQRIEWYFDVISPFAYLQWQQVKPLMERVEVTPVPILFAGLLNHFGQLGPAEIPAKRLFTYQHCMWLAAKHKIPFCMPAAHPFNPLSGLRLCIALDNAKQALDTVFNCIWQQGFTPDSAQGSDFIAEQLGREDWLSISQHDDVKQTLKDNTQKAITNGVFGVPSSLVYEQKEQPALFWGLDAHQMLLDYVDQHAFFKSNAYLALSGVPQAANRQS